MNQIESLLAKKEMRLSQVSVIEKELSELPEEDFAMKKALKAKKQARLDIIKEIEGDLQELGYKPEKESKKVEASIAKQKGKPGRKPKAEVKAEEVKTVVVTQEILNENPELVGQGVAVGDEVEVEEE